MISATRRSRNWLFLALGCAVVLLTGLWFFSTWRQASTLGPGAESARESDSHRTGQAELRKRWRVRNTMALMSKNDAGCALSDDAEFDLRWLTLPRDQRKAGHIDSLSRELCRPDRSP